MRVPRWWASPWSLWSLWSPWVRCAVAGLALALGLGLGLGLLVSLWAGYLAPPRCGQCLGWGGVRLLADTVLAQGQPGPGGGGGGGGDPTQQVVGIVERARQWLMWMLTAVVGLIIVFAGLRYAFAGGHIEEIEAAKRTLKSAISGYLLAVLADSLVSILRMVAGS